MDEDHYRKNIKFFEEILDDEQEIANSENFSPDIIDENFDSFSQEIQENMNNESQKKSPIVIHKSSPNYFRETPESSTAIYSPDSILDEFYSELDSEQNYFGDLSSGKEQTFTEKQSVKTSVYSLRDKILAESSDELNKKQSKFDTIKSMDSKDSFHSSYSDYVQMVFPPRPLKGMASSLRGRTADRYIREALENKTYPKWFYKLNKHQFKIFFSLFKLLAVSKNILPVQIFEILKHLDIALTIEEVQSVMKKFYEEDHKRIDFYRLLFALCNSRDYIEKIKNDTQLWKEQMRGIYTKRQILFYTITSHAMFPEFPIDPTYYRLKAKYSAHPLKQFLICQRLTGWPQRLAIKQELEMLKEVANWRKKILSPYTDNPFLPPEPPLVYQQRKRKEAIRRHEVLGIKPNPIYLEEEKRDKRRRECHMKKDHEAEAICQLIDDTVNRTYKDKPKPRRRYRPNDWVQHKMFRILAPLPLIPLPRAQLEALMKFNVSVFQLPGIYDKVDQQVSKYYNRLQTTLMESCHEHWITTYTDEFQHQRLKEKFSKIFKDYFVMRKSDVYVRKPWQKPSHWVSVHSMHERPPFS